MTFENGNVMRVTCKMSINGEDVQNTYHIRNNGAGELSYAATTTEMLTRIDNSYGAVSDQQADDYSYDTMEFFNVTKDEPAGEFNWPTRTVGALQSPPLPYQVAGLTLFPTTTARSQGRKYVGGFTEDGSDAVANPSTVVVTAMLNFALGLVAPWLVGSGEFEFGNYNPTLVRFAEWLTPIIREVWRTQRRRASGVGS